MKNNMDKIVNPSKEKIEEYLAIIGWSLKHHGCDSWYFYNHSKKRTNMCLWFPSSDSRIEIETTSRTYKGHPKIYFYMKECVMELLHGNCVCFSAKDNKSIFILCQNFDKNLKN